MDPSRLTLDNPAFSGRLRQGAGGSTYVSRPTPQHAKRFQDIGAPLKPAFAPTPPAIKPAPEPVVVQPLIAPTPAPTTEVERPFQVAPPKVSRFKLPNFKLPVLPQRPPALYVMAGLLFMVGLVVSLQGFHTNHIAQAQVNKLSSKAAAGASDSAPPSTIKPSALSIANYQVAPDLPRYIDIPSLSVHARVFAVATTKTGALATPSNVYDTAWYNASSKPGQPGAMLIDGHISSWTAHGVFYGLKNLKSGDKITITRGDGTPFTYTVVKTVISAADSVDMASMLVSQDVSKPGLNLMSCSGDVIPGTNEFDKRIAVYAVLN